MRLYSGVRESLPAGIYPLMTSYRHKVFVERLGWQLTTPDGMERDQFDRPDTVYVVASNELGDVCGCARLLPTTQPYLLSEVFPDLLNGLSPPSSADVWELSRFAALDFSSRSSHGNGFYSSPITKGVLDESVNIARARGAKRMLTVSPLGVERLLRRLGFKSHRAGPPKLIDGQPVFACYIELE